MQEQMERAWKNAADATAMKKLVKKARENRLRAEQKHSGTRTKDIEVGDCVWHSANQQDRKFGRDGGRWRVTKALSDQLPIPEHMYTGQEAKLSIDQCGRTASQ